MRQPPSEEENEVWGYITKCRQQLAWQLGAAENADLRGIVFPALAHRSDSSYERHATLAGRLRDEEYADDLRQVMHIYHTVVMDVCDWMIYNKEYFHLLIGEYTTFDAFANAIDAAILDECKGTQSRVWTRKGMVELDEPLHVGTPQTSHDDVSDSDTEPQTESPTEPASAQPHAHNGLHAPRATPTTACNPNTITVHGPKPVLTPALAVLTHLPAHHKHHVKPRVCNLHTPPATPPDDAKDAPAPATSPSPSGKPHPDSVLFKPEPAPEHHDHDHDHAMQSIDILDDEAYKPHIGLVTPQNRPASMCAPPMCAGSPRPLVPPLSRRPTIAAPAADHEPHALAAPAPRRATVAFPSDAPHPLLPRPASAAPLLPGPSPSRRGSTWELSLVDNYTHGRSSPHPGEASPDHGPTFPLSTPFYTPSRAPSPQPGPATPPADLGPTFDIPTPFYVKPRRDTVAAPPPGPASPTELVGPTFDIPTPFFVKPRRPTLAVAPESPTMPDGPTFPVSTPFFAYATRSAQRALSPEPALGPTFAVNTPLFTYASRAQEPEPASPDEPTGPTFPVNTPLFTYAASTLPQNRKKSPERTEKARAISPEPPLGPTFPVRTPLFMYSYRPLPEPEPASPDEPMGPTFPVNTPLFTYDARTLPQNRKTKSPEPESYPLWSPPFAPNYTPEAPTCASPPPEHRPVMISVPGLKIIAPSIASSKLETFPSSRAETFAAEVSPKSEAFVESAEAEAESASAASNDIVTPEPTPALKDAEFRDPSEVPSEVPCTFRSVTPPESPTAPEPEPESVAPGPGPKPVDLAQSPEHPDESLDKFPLYAGSEGSAADSANDAAAPSSASLASLPAISIGAAVPASPPAPSPGAGAGPGSTPASPRRNESSTTIRTVSDGSPVRAARALAKRPSLWDKDEYPSHAASGSTSSAPAGPAPHPSPPARVRPMSSNGSLQHQWWKIGRGRRNSVHSQD